ncbi:MAG: hypothetical protein KTR29_17860 [Rhodothermaceae bacterium]|nr:hypothetical protein [Rhodothermaceae bacterium]
MKFSTLIARPDIRSSRLNVSIYSIYFIFVFLFLFTAGCASTEYIGETYAPTSDVEIFYSEDAVPYEFTTIGQALGTGVWVKNRKIQNKLVDEAMNRGADAILITGLGQSHIPLGEDGGSAREKQINASFLKYR